MIDKRNVLDGGQGEVALLDCMGSELTIVNAARVCFGKHTDTLREKDAKLIRYLHTNKHTSPFEHVVFTFLVKCPLYVRSQWHRHRTGAYNEISRRYTEEMMEIYLPEFYRAQAEDNRQASTDPGSSINQTAVRQDVEAMHKNALALYDKLLEAGVCREQARGVLPQNTMTQFWYTVSLHNLNHFLELRDSDHAQGEIREYARAIKDMLAPRFPNVAEAAGW